jgi:hypothetical protein
MPHLNPLTFRKLKYLPGDRKSFYLNLPVRASDISCWNWALSGFAPNVINPSPLFMYVAEEIDLDGGTPIQAWADNNGGANRRTLNALRADWNGYRNEAGTNASPARLDTLHQINTALTALSASLNGLTVSPGWTPYRVAMHYDVNVYAWQRNPRTGQLVATNTVKEMAGPNFTHWWLQVEDGGLNNDGIEAFPGSPNVTFRRPEYDSGSRYTCKINVTELHDRQVRRIEDLLDDGISQNWIQNIHRARPKSKVCFICGKHLITGINRHLCHCCGGTVCSDCSPATRHQFIHGPGIVCLAGPNCRGKRGRGHRVCMYC